MATPGRPLEEAARGVFTPRQVHLRLGEAGTVPCYIRPSFYLATWTRDNASLFSITADQSSGLRIDGKTGWLEWSEVGEEARGEYRCQAYNRMGTAGQTYQRMIFSLTSGKYFITLLKHFPGDWQ